MNKKLTTALAFTAAVMGMGVAMPSCPGQQAMQQQIDTFQADNAKLKQTVTGLDGQVKSLNSDMGQAKQLLEQMTTTITAQKGAIDKLEASMQELQTKLAESFKPKKSTIGPKKHPLRH